jgi:transposase-like protein
VFKKFSSEEACIARLERVRWPDGLRCIRCGQKRIRRLKTKGKTGKGRDLYWCWDCHYKYSVTVGTIFHDSHLPLTKWFSAIKMFYVKKVVSATQLQRKLGLGRYETAWKMARCIRLAMQEDPEFYQTLFRRRNVGAALVAVSPIPEVKSADQSRSEVADCSTPCYHAE